MYRIRFLCFLLSLVAVPRYALAQRQDPDTFFRPVRSSDLFAKLPPRLDQERLLGADINDNFLSFEGGGCPEQIFIGSVEENSGVFGNVDIEVFIDGSIFIKCGR